MADLKHLLDVLLIRNKHVCPWWLCFAFDNPLRRLIHDPRKILSPKDAFAATVESAVKSGFRIKQEPPVALSRAVLFSPAEG